MVEDYLRKVLPSKIRLDALYLRQRSILNDLDVIFLTMIVLLPGLRKNGIPEKLLYRGPLVSLYSRFLNWFVIDWLVAFAAVGVCGFIWRLSGPLNLGLASAAMTAFLMALFFSLSNSVLRINRISWRTARAISAVDLGVSAGLTTLLLLAIDLVWPFYVYKLPAGMIFLTGMFAFGGFLTARYRERVLTGVASRWLAMRKSTTHLGERVIIVGAGHLGEFVNWVISHGEFARTFNIVGFVDDDYQKHGMRISEHPVLGSIHDLPTFIQKHDVGVVIFAISNISSAQQRHILSICRQTKAKTVLFPNILDMMRASLSPEFDPDLEPDPAIIIPPNFSPKEDLPRVVAELDDLLDRGDIATVRSCLHDLRGLLSSEGSNSGKDELVR
jgi:hypothetical protein